MTPDRDALAAALAKEIHIDEAHGFGTTTPLELADRLLAAVSMTHDRDGWPDPDPLFVPEQPAPSEPPSSRRLVLLLALLAGLIVIAALLPREVV